LPYDYLNRRAGKKVWEKVDNNWVERSHHLYVYTGTALIAEIDATTRQVLRAFAYGATGELLMIQDRTTSSAPQTYLPVHDATGSVTGIMRAVDNTIAATYEYDPSGNLLRAKGDYAKQNPFTHAGAWTDWETGLINAGSVYYSPRLGRTINSAPSGFGNGLTACYGVAPTSDYLTPRHYAPLPVDPLPGRIDKTSAQWRAYEKALAEYNAAVAAYDAWRDEYQAATRGGAPPEDCSAEEFVADRMQGQAAIYIDGIYAGDCSLGDEMYSFLQDMIRQYELNPPSDAPVNGSPSGGAANSGGGGYSVNGSGSQVEVINGRRIRFSVDIGEATVLSYTSNYNGKEYDWDYGYGDMGRFEPGWRPSTLSELYETLGAYSAYDTAMQMANGTHWSQVGSAPMSVFEILGNYTQTSGLGASLQAGAKGGQYFAIGYTGIVVGVWAAPVVVAGAIKGGSAVASAYGTASTALTNASIQAWGLATSVPGATTIRVAAALGYAAFAGPSPGLAPLAGLRMDQARTMIVVVVTAPK